MSFTTLITASRLDEKIGHPDWCIVDTRFSLNDTERGRRDYQAGHIPGAVYAHLDEDLCGPLIPGQTGRHPLPNVDIFASKLSRWGIGYGTQVIVYDDLGGAIAARLWWMLNWLGHDRVALLDGGWPVWQSEKRAITKDLPTPVQRFFRPEPNPSLLARTDEIEKICLDSSYRLLDARAVERYRGENEPIDPVAGRIPGARSAPWAENLDATGRFYPPEILRSRYALLVDDTPASRIVCYCGSGVTAALNLVALAIAGFGQARLYAGSWSKWITNFDHPIINDYPVSQ